MKKILLVASLILIASCTHQNQKISLDLSLNSNKTNSGNGASIDLMVFDDRANDTIVGTKEFGQYEKIDISSRENIALLLTQTIEQNLIQRGFKKGNGKIFEIHIEQLNYVAKRGFPIGTSQGNASIKVVVKNTKTRTIVTKNFSLSLNNKHFIVPLESTDLAIINNMIQEITQDIVNNSELIRTLAQ